MAFSPDVLVTALQELIPGYSETFTKWHPAFDAIVKKGQKVTAKGPYREFALVPSGPGQITPILTGNEVIAGGRTMNSVRANTYAATMIYAYDVPGQDLREANGEMDLVQLIKRYPERAIMDFHERIAQQLVAGNGAGAGSFPMQQLKQTPYSVLLRTPSQAGTTSTATSLPSLLKGVSKCERLTTMRVRKWLTQKAMLTCSLVTVVPSTTTSKTLMTKFKSSLHLLKRVTVLLASSVKVLSS